MQSLTTVSYQVLVNGSSTESFIPNRGLRQGDPLSPYLFILCLNVLSCMLNVAEHNGQIQGVRASRNAPSINHLLYAVDLLLFFQVTRLLLTYYSQDFLNRCLD